MSLTNHCSASGCFKLLGTNINMYKLSISGLVPILQALLSLLIIVNYVITAQPMNIILSTYTDNIETYETAG